MTRLLHKYLVLTAIGFILIATGGCGTTSTTQTKPKETLSSSVNNVKTTAKTLAINSTSEDTVDPKPQPTSEPKPQSKLEPSPQPVPKLIPKPTTTSTSKPTPKPKQQPEPIITITNPTNNYAIPYPSDNMQHINLSWTIINQTAPVDCDLYLIDEIAGTSVDPANPSVNVCDLIRETSTGTHSNTIELSLSDLKHQHTYKFRIVAISPGPSAPVTSEVTFSYR